MRQLHFPALFTGLFLALTTTADPAAAKKPSDIYYETIDDFKDGFSEVGTHGANATWAYFAFGPAFTGNDGFVSTGPHGLRVVPTGMNSVTGLPAFLNTVAQEPISGLPGGVDHVKWLAYTNHFADTGFPGYDAKPGRVVACESIVSGRTFGTEYHPFGGAVDNANDDLRLAAFAMNTIDVETFMVYDFFITNETVYAFYERLPFGRGPALGNYAAFSYAVPVANYHPYKKTLLKIAYDKSAGKVYWFVNGHKVMQVDNIGMRLPSREFMTIDHGGVETPVSPNQINCGMGMFTLLDAHLPSGQGLVRLSNAPNFYFNPEVGEPVGETYIDDDSLESSRLFGQGAELRVKRYWISSLPSWLY
ncbi:MAG: DUF6081 family protein [Polyangiaceae bacterium]